MNSRIAITAALSFLVLSRRLSKRQCLSLLLLIIGCRQDPFTLHASSQTRLSVASAKGSVAIPSLAMVFMVLVQATLSSLSSVYIEKLLKVEVGAALFPFCLQHTRPRPRRCPAHSTP